jgi:hypothetical protein
MRLAPSEEASAAVVSTLQDVRGHYDAEGRYVSADGARDRELRVEARAMTKLGRSVQVGAIVPWLRTVRSFGDSSGSGSGIGDITLLGRYDFVRVGGEDGLPGIAFTFATALPTGRSAEHARDALGADTTGLGTWEVRPGVAIEKSWWTGWFVSGSLAAGFFGAYRRDDGTSVALGPRVLSFIGGGKSFTNGLGLAAGLSYEHQLAPKIDATRMGRDPVRASGMILGSYEIDDHWQVFASLLADFAGREQLANRTFGIGLRRAWNVYE